MGEVKSFFVKEAQTRAEFARQLELAASLPTEESGTSTGAIRSHDQLKAFGDSKKAA
jgi:hypothetical protein